MPLIDPCARHPQNRARARCVQCNMWICEECTVAAHERSFCSPECLRSWQVDRERDVLEARNRISGIRRGVRWARWTIIGSVLLLVIHLCRDSWDFLYDIDLIGHLLGN